MGRQKKRAPKKGITCYFHPQTKDDLDMLARIAGESMSAMVERAVEAFIAKNKDAILQARSVLNKLEDF